MVRLYFSGLYFPFNNLARYGFALVEEKFFYRECGRVSCRDTNEIEYHALIKGLEMALKFGFRHIHILCDNPLVVDQIFSLCEVDNPTLCNLLKKVKSLLEKFEKYCFSQIRREDNFIVDFILRVNFCVSEQLQEPQKKALLPFSGGLQ